MRLATLQGMADELTKIAGFNRGFVKPNLALAKKLQPPPRAVIPSKSAANVRGKPFSGGMRSVGRLPDSAAASRAA